MDLDRARTSAAQRIVRSCRESLDARALRLAVLRDVREAVAFDAYAWLLTDPETEVGCAPLADVPWLHELPSMIRLKYCTGMNRWTRLSAPVGLLSEATRGRMDRSLVWRELLSRYDVVDVASVVFRDHLGCWAFLELWRIGAARPFATGDAGFLTQIASGVTEALRRASARSFHMEPTAPAIGEGPVVLMLTPELDVKAQTAETDAYLRELVPPDEDQRPVPAAAYNVAAQLCALEAGVDSHPPTARVHLSGGRWVTLRAARISDGGPRERQDIAVTIEATSPAERLVVFALASGLSPREAEVLTHVATGASTREVSQRMFLSEHTVQDHLKSIFEKTGVRTRNALVAIATGAGA